MPLPRVLLQLDTDHQPSAFDAVVALDSGVAQILRHGLVTPEEVPSLVHGAIFTRGMPELNSTAIFVGGSDAPASESLFRRVLETFFGPFRVSVMWDPNGANTTAVAAVLAVERHQKLSSSRVLILGATGPVGRRVSALLAGLGSNVMVGSRSLPRATALCRELSEAAETTRDRLMPVETANPRQIVEQARIAEVVISAAAAGAALVSVHELTNDQVPRILIDLNAVPPAGLSGVVPTDRGENRNGAMCYGALGIGGRKMKLHRRAIESLFDRNDLVLDLRQLYSLGKELD